MQGGYRGRIVKIKQGGNMCYVRLNVIQSIFISCEIYVMSDVRVLINMHRLAVLPNIIG